ncbi:CUB and zona pellucida-like domain-containing protein 1 [Lissotriton helveticus]
MWTIRWGVSLLLLSLGLALAEKDPLEVQAKCGANLQDPWKTLPLILESNADCTWTITKEDNRTIRLIFSDYKFNPSSDCSQENVTVYDGDSSNATSLGGLCKDSRASAIFESSSSTLTFRILTDSAEFERSFFAFYYYYSPDDVSQQCGGKLTDPSGTFTSPNYPAFHPHFTFCVWHIEVKPKKTIHVVFSEIFLEIDPTCRFDFLALYDGPNTSSPLIEEVCGRTKRQYDSSSNSLTVLLSADYANSYRGFSATYTAESNITLTCAPDIMTVVIKQSYLQWLGYTEKDLSLLDPTCGTNTSNPVEFNIPFNSCGTLKQVVENHTVIYTNVITASPGGAVVTRQKMLQIIARCEMSSKTIVEIMYTTENDIIQMESSNNHYDISINFFKSAAFDEPVNESPYYVELNQTLYTEIALHSSDSNLEVFIESCIASPKSNFGPPNYDLIQYGCEKDETCHINSLHESYGRFQFSAFKFLKQQPSIYLQCKVVVCDRNDTNSRCTQGCLPRHKRDLSSHRRTVNAVVGPIRLKANHGALDQSDAINRAQSDATAGSQGTTGIFLVAVVVLAVNAVILVLGALRSYRNTHSGYRYQKVPGL